MIRLLEQLIAALFNRLRGRQAQARSERGSLDLGFRAVDGDVTRRHMQVSNTRRTTHIAVLGKTGTGKSFFLRYLAQQQDIERDRGFLYFDLHGDATPDILRAINARERQRHEHLDHKLILIEPADPVVSVGFNPLERDEAHDFVRNAELAEVLTLRWGLDRFGARTDEVLRNSLYVLSANGLTLVELAPLLSNAKFRAHCLTHVDNVEVREYFEQRFDRQSLAMQAVLREPVLNKTSTFTADPHFRHIVGQAHSSFSLVEAMDRGYWVIVNLDKGRLGAQALTLGSLIFTMLKSALFRREKRSLFTVYCDEIQNLISFGTGIETILSEARKFGVGIVSANQFLDQYPTEIRAAILSVGTHVFFQLSSTDAEQIARALDGGRPLSERLKNLYQRHAIVKTGAERWTEVRVPDVRTPQVDPIDLLNRCRGRWGRPRVVIEREIAKRQEEILGRREEPYHAWKR
jgi:Type IV secretion-system coupling protein DNA-binding domain